MSFNFVIYLFFGIAPSLIWLFYYLKKDLHPESKKMILKIFICGALITVPTLFVELKLLDFLNFLDLPSAFSQLLRWFLVIALTEEIFKYLVVKFMVLKNPEFDEPIDSMIYMVVSALGFAAAENILYLILPTFQQPASLILPFNYIITSTLVISAGRFLGANFLHTLCSATIGYFMALSFCKPKDHLRLLIIGFFTAVALHGFYNFSIITIGQGFVSMIIPIIILIVLAIFVMKEFEKAKKLKSICKINA